MFQSLNLGLRFKAIETTLVLEPLKKMAKTSNEMQVKTINLFNDLKSK